jgi:hypothetical protein
MREIKEIIGSLQSNIKNKSRKGVQTISRTAARLRSRTSTLTDQLRRRLTGSKGRP